MTNNTMKKPSVADFDIYRDFTNADHPNKAAIGKKYGVSPRTVGRAVERVEKWNNQKEQTKAVEKKPVTKKAVKAPEMVAPVPVKESKVVTIPYSAVVTQNSISMWHGSDTVSIVESHPKFKEIRQIIVDGKLSQECLEKAFILSSEKAAIESVCVGDVKLDPASETVLYKGRPIDIRLTKHIVKLYNDGHTEKMKGLLAFSDRLMKNPSNRAVNELFTFIDGAGIEIDSEGYVLAFKKVSSDFKDIYSGKFDNSVGTVVSVERNMVDENSEKTCSYGLHVCAKSYLGSYGSRENVAIILCKVDPADFVAVPKDYRNAKARVCGYEVIKDVTKEIKY